MARVVAPLVAFLARAAPRLSAGRAGHYGKANITLETINAMIGAVSKP